MKSSEPLLIAAIVSSFSAFLVVFLRTLYSSYKAILLAQKKKTDFLVNVVETQKIFSPVRHPLDDEDEINIDEFDEPMATLTFDRTFKKINLSFAELLGRSPQELIGKPSKEFLTPDSIRELEERQKRRDNGEKSPAEFPVEFLVKGEERATIRLVNTVRVRRDKKLKPVGFLVIYRKEGERENVELEKERATKRLTRLAMEKARIVFSLDADSSISEVTGPVEDLLGYSKEALHGQSIFSLLSAKEEHIHLYKACIQKGLEIPGIPRIHRNTSIRTAEASRYFHTMLIGQENKKTVLGLIDPSRSHDLSETESITHSKATLYN